MRMLREDGEDSGERKAAKRVQAVWCAKIQLVFPGSMLAGFRTQSLSRFHPSGLCGQGGPRMQLG